jgi:6-phosphogluconolactonase
LTYKLQCTLFLKLESHYFGEPPAPAGGGSTIFIDIKNLCWYTPNYLKSNTLSMKEKKMVALSVGKKRKLGALSSMLSKTVGVVSLVAILASCGTSPGYSYTVGGTVSGLAGSGLVLQNNGGDDRSLSANGAFSFPTPLSDAAAYTITVKTQPTTPSQICTVNNGSGTINSGPVGNVVVSCVTGSASVAFLSSGAEEFAYVAKTNGTTSDGTISAYTISTTNGTLSPLGTPVAAGKFPASITVAGGFAYVANMSDNTISAYTISTTDWTLSPLGTPIVAGKYPTSITVDPSGKFAYVVNMGDNTISAYTISMVDGTLSPLGTPVAAGMSPVSIVTVSVGSLGEFAYVANMGDGSIWTYSINLTTGTLQPLSSIIAGTSPTSVTVDPSRQQFAYVTNEGDNTISAYTIDQTYGTLAASTITPTVIAGTNPTSIVTVSVGSSIFAYATNTSGCTISAYSIGTDGSLNELTAIGSPFSTGAGTYPTSITVDPSGQFAYVVNADDGSISVYKINLDGTLTPQ